MVAPGGAQSLGLVFLQGGITTALRLLTALDSLDTFQQGCGNGDLVKCLEPPTNYTHYFNMPNS